MTSVCVGLMSGTSLDAIDAAACAFGPEGQWNGLLCTHSRPYPEDLRAELLHLQRSPDTLLSARDFARLDQAIGAAFADVAAQLIRQLPAGTPILAIGSHGQTVFHDPSDLRTSTQLGNPSLIAATTGIRTVADFRRADMALGGQGAPLVPAFHQAVFASATPRVIANIGGIANITVLPGPDPQHCFGFDTGPGNALLDEWIHRHRGEALDRDGHWTASGKPEPDFLAACLRDPYFALPPPKSTGRDYFNLKWLQNHGDIDMLAPADVQRSLGELTVESLARAIEQHAPDSREFWACGGGARNGWLMGRLRERLAPAMTVRTTAELGLGPAWVEAAAFAWLAWRTVNGQPGNLPSVTGASRAAILGGVFAP